MSVQVRRRREAASFLSTFVGAQGELLVDTTNNRVQVHDGATPGGWPAARLAEVLTNTRTSVADAAYTALTSDRTIAVTSLTAARTVTLPAAAAYPTGTQLLIFDESGACSAVNTITIARAGTDVVNGGASVAIAAAYGYVALESNGSGRWTVVDQTPSSIGGGTRTAVADANYMAQTTDRLVAYTALTAARTVTLPPSSAFPLGAQLFVIDETGACSTSNTLTIVGSGTDTINGAASASITTAYGYLAFESNGAGKWTLIDQSAAASGGTLRTPIADASYAALTTDRVIGYTSLTATRTVTLPAAAAFPVGTRLLVLDEGGNASATVTIAIARAGSDTIDGGASAVISTAYGYVAMQSNGTSRWTVVDQATIPTTALTGSLQAGQFPALGGDVTTTAGSVTTTLATVNGTPGTFGAASTVPMVTVNGKGQTTGVTTTAVVAPAGTLSGAALAANVTGSSLTGVGTLTSGGTGAGFTVALSASTVTGTLGIGSGGTGTSTAAGARGSLGAAASGANADITSLSALATPLSVAQGGTGASSGAGASAALGITARTAVNDASVTATATSRTIAYTAITAARTVALPAASSFPVGTQLLVVDEFGSCSAANTITVAANGSDRIDGAASLVLSLAFGYVAIVSNGAGAWTIVDQSTAGMAQQTPGNVAITGGAINGTGIGQSSPAAVAATNFSATGTVTLPANCVTLAAMAQAPAGTLRGNPSGSTANVSDSALTAYLDAAFGSSQGAVLLRGSSGWGALTPGTSGYVLTSNGAGANPTYQAGGSSAPLPRSAVRQTVQGGPQSSGAPSFLPGSSANLNLTAQNIATGANALTIAAAQGYNSTGQNDIITQITSNPTWSSLAASATVYLYVNAASGVTGSTTLQPIYQSGGTISTASGQFSFDYQSMVGWMGNGSAAVATPLVFVGEVVTSSSAVTATTAYPYNGYYESASVTGLPGTATNITRNHNLGLTPQGQPDIVLTCVTADQGFPVGSTLHAAQFYTVDGNGRIPVVIGVTRATLTSITGSSAAFAVLPYSGGNGVVLTSANWSYKTIVRRGWGGA